MKLNANSIEKTKLEIQELRTEELKMFKKEILWRS